MNYYETKIVTEAINLIQVARTASDAGNYLHDAAVRLQFVMDCGESLGARQLATTVAEAFDMMSLIDELRNEAAA
jgi:hypothetical protein